MEYLLASIVLILSLSHGQSTCPNPTVPDDCKHCTSHDDPHFTTWDGVRYDQHTDGCFKYVTTCPSAAYDLPFEICGCHYNCGGGAGTGDDQACPSSIRCVGDITITFFDAGVTSFEVTVDVDNPTDDAIDALSSSLSTGTTYTFDSTGHYFIYTKTGSIHEFEVFSDPYSSVFFYAHIRYQPGNFEVHLNDDYFSDVTCGLCGLFSLVDTDDFTGSDGSLYLSPTDVASGPIDPIVVTQINDFANTYLCDPSATIPTDPGCALDPETLDCYNVALICCDSIWADIGWTNAVLDEGVFVKNWGTNCALDACALSNNNVSCSNMGDEFSFAKNIADQTATAVYQTTPIETRSPTVSPTEGFESNCTAKICAHGDNKIVLDVSYDAGSSWDLAVATQSNWKITMNAVINPIDANTVLRFTVYDWSVIGGFIATVQLCGTNGYVFSFFTDEINTFFDVISDTSGDPLIDVFHEFGDGPWAGFVNDHKVECMNTDADWIWNDKKLNTMVFELDFAHHTDILQRLECVEEETPVPTTDCCTVGLDDYLEMCYCDTVPATTRTPIGVTAVTLGEAVMKAEVRVAGGHSVGINRVGDGGGAVYNTINEEMKEIKYMIYATWIIIFSCFMINIVFSNNCWNKKEKEYI